MLLLVLAVGEATAGAAARSYGLLADGAGVGGVEVPAGSRGRRGGSRIRGYPLRRGCRPEERTLAAAAGSRD